MGGDQEPPIESLDYSKFDPKFTNEVEKIGSEWGELYDKKLEYIQQNRQNAPQPLVPENIVGLVKKTGRLPATRNWYRRTSSFERNGFFNIHTPVFNTKWLAWFFPTFMIWGWTQFQIQGYNFERFNDLGERKNLLYWKLQYVELPLAKLWLRPG